MAKAIELTEFEKRCADEIDKNDIELEWQEHRI